MSADERMKHAGSEEALRNPYWMERRLSPWKYPEGNSPDDSNPPTSDRVRQYVVSRRQSDGTIISSYEHMTMAPEDLVEELLMAMMESGEIWHVMHYKEDVKHLPYHMISSAKHMNSMGAEDYQTRITYLLSRD